MTTNITYKLKGLGILLAGVLMTTSCNDWLGEETPGSTKLEDFFTEGETCVQTINGCYAPLAWEFNASYFSEWFIGDIASDDALKGGQNVAEGGDAYDIDNFKVNANNTILLDYYRAKYAGIIRCNLALDKVEDFEPDASLDQRRKDCLVGEAYFLRAMYYFQLVRVFGGVPLVHEVLDSSDRWLQPRASVDDVYESIFSDLMEAEKRLYNKSEYAPEDMGRATRGAAQALLCKAYLYHKDYDLAYKWGKKFVDEQYGTRQYTLCQVYSDNFTLAGENGPESVFEIQYMEEPTSDYGQGFGFTRGTFTTILTRPRMSYLGNKAGWGWNHPTQNLYDEFEPGDPRLEAAIGVPDEAGLEEQAVTYLGSPYYNNKTAYSEGGTWPQIGHHSRGELNYRLIRAADVLLLYAEAALESGKDLNAAKWALEEVRSRARNNSPEMNALPTFPGYLGLSDTPEGLRNALRHERRVELAMEGHRWFDLVRWGIAAEIMDRDKGSYGRSECEEARAEMANFVPGKHELFPIPSEEIALNPMEQNPGY
ncbi:MAG: RagB/SusD family nutrient uptake outer membrane protein [Muribaculaceae bacterium]|nr:RagB/SusD family nutrient uptake outer membrane protein [Muribaculaceae bacterium]